MASQSQDHSVLLHLLNVILNWVDIYTCFNTTLKSISKNLLVFKSAVFSQVYIASVYVMFFFKIH